MKYNRFFTGARILALSFAYLAAWAAAAPAVAQHITIKEGHATVRSGQDHWANTFKE